MYHLHRKKVNRLSKSFIKKYYDKQIDGLKYSKPRNWWKGMKELLGCNNISSDTPLLHLPNQVCEGDLKDLSQHKKYFFKSVSDHLPALCADNDYIQLEVPYAPAEYAISVEEVEHHIHNLDTSKAHGPESVRRDGRKTGLVMKK